MPQAPARTGPLAGLKVVEFAGMGPGPFCCMLLADMGADVIRIDRAPTPGGPDPRLTLVNRNRRSLVVDLKQPEGVATVRRLLAQADALVEGFRPGVMERLGLGPQDCLAANPRLVYGRVTGWGQDGPLAQVAGHDINYIALAGVLHTIGPAGGAPVPPLNLIGDYGGGALYLAFGLLCALLECRSSGRGQVVDAAMLDGSASLMTMLYTHLARGHWRTVRGDNLLDGGTPWYAVYETSDGQHVSVGALEPAFWRVLTEHLGPLAQDLPDRKDSTQREALRQRLAQIFRSRTRDEWCALLEGTEACFAPVLSPLEAPQHPHLQAGQTFVQAHGQVQPAPAPRLSRTPADLQRPPPLPGEHTVEVLQDWGFGEGEVQALCAVGAVLQT